MLSLWPCRVLTAWPSNQPYSNGPSEIARSNNYFGTEKLSIRYSLFLNTEKIALVEKSRVAHHVSLGSPGNHNATGRSRAGNSYSGGLHEPCEGQPAALDLVRPLLDAGQVLCAERGRLLRHPAAASAASAHRGRNCQHTDTAQTPSPSPSPHHRDIDSMIGACIAYRQSAWVTFCAVRHVGEEAADGGVLVLLLVEAAAQPVELGHVAAEPHHLAANTCSDRWCTVVSGGESPCPDMEAGEAPFFVPVLLPAASRSSSSTLSCLSWSASPVNLALWMSSASSCCRSRSAPTSTVTFFSSTPPAAASYVPANNRQQTTDYGSGRTRSPALPCAALPCPTFLGQSVFSLLLADLPALLLQDEALQVGDLRVDPGQHTLQHGRVVPRFHLHLRTPRTQEPHTYTHTLPGRVA